MPTAITGKIVALDTSTPGTTGFVRFWLRGTRGNEPRITGTGAIAPQFNGSGFYVDLPSDASGNVSGSIYSTRDNAGTGNGEIEVGGSYTAVYYGMVIYNNNTPGPEVPVHAKISTTLDISSVSPVSTQAVSVAPTGDTTYLRLDGGNSPVTGATTFNGGITTKKLNNVRFADQFSNLQAAHDDLPSTGGTVVIPPGYSETMAANLVVSKSGVTFLGMGSGIITMGSHSVTQAGGIHGTCFKGVIPFGGANFATSNGLRFIYTGNGKAFNIGDGAGTTCRAFEFSDITIDLTGASSGASGLYLTNVVYFRMNNPAVVGNNSTTGIKGMVLDGTGNFTGTGTIINPYVLGFATGILGTGTVGAGANSVIIIGGTVQSSVASAIGVDLEIADSNSIYGLDIESCSVGVKFGANAAGCLVSIRQEVNTTDFQAIAGSANNVGIVLRANLPIVSDAGTNNSFHRIQDAPPRFLSFTSASSNPATAGQIALANSDLIAWRNAANSANHRLRKLAASSGTVPADAMYFDDGSGNPVVGFWQSPIIATAASAPANAGDVRLADTGTINFRNHANSADITGVTKDTNDVIQVGSAGMKVAGATPTVSASQLGLGVTSGFGNGAAATGVTTTAKGTGSGPTTAQTIVNYLKVNIGGTDYWIPLVQ